MKCPKCNHIIKEGYVLCDSCGYDIQMVPDFDAKVESEMDETLSSLLEGINLEDLTDEDVQRLSQTLDLQMTNDLKHRLELARTRDLRHTDSDKKRRKPKKEKKLKLPFNPLLLLIPLIIVILIAFIVSNAVSAYHYRNSAAGLLERAQKESSENNFSQAAELYQQVLEIEPGNEQAALGLSWNLMMTGDEDGAKDVLVDLISETGSRDAYDQLVSLYESEKNFSAISQLIENCDNDQIRNKYSAYIVAAPEFDQEQGTYVGEIVLKLMSPVPGTIYFTLDGSEPGEDSEEYISPITLSYGKNVVRAIFVNEKGVKSDSVSHIYEITKATPDAPSVSPDEGDFKHARYIEAASAPGLVVYYTDDGTVPDERSKSYEGPIVMKSGRHIYRFISVDSEGVRSDMVSATYTLTVEEQCHETEAVNYVITSMMALGQISDIFGTAMDGSGIYSYESIGIVNEGEADYYLIEEMFQPAGQTELISKEFFAVDTVTGLLKRATKNSEGYFDLSAF